MEYKETNKQAAKQTKEGNSKKRSNKLKKKYDTLSGMFSKHCLPICIDLHFSFDN